MNQKQAGQDCETICELLDSVQGKLDDVGGSEKNAGSGQIMAWINEPSGVFYFYHDCERFFKYIRPVCRSCGQ